MRAACYYDSPNPPFIRSNTKIARARLRQELRDGRPPSPRGAPVQALPVAQRAQGRRAPQQARRRAAPRCLDCRRRFSANIGFRYRRHPGEITTECLRLRFSGMSVRRLAGGLEARGITAGNAPYAGGSRGTARWPTPTRTDKARRRRQSPRGRNLLERRRQAEVPVRPMDDETRHRLALGPACRREGRRSTGMFRDAPEQADRMPDAVVADGLNPCRAAARSVMPVTEHVRGIRITGDKAGTDNNNRVERLNGTIRGREKTFGCLRGARTEFCVPRVDHNRARRHQAPRPTPGEAAGIRVAGADK